MLNVGPECEFFLFHTDEEGRPTTSTHEMAGYFDVSPIDLAENVRRDIVLNLEEMGFQVEASIMRLHRPSMRLISSIRTRFGLRTIS